MSAKHPIVSIVGSSGSGTTPLKDTFEHIFQTERVKAAFVKGGAFHRFDRDMRLIPTPLIMRLVERRRRELRAPTRRDKCPGH